MTASRPCIVCRTPCVVCAAAERQNYALVVAIADLEGVANDADTPEHTRAKMDRILAAAWAVLDAKPVVGSEGTA